MKISKRITTCLSAVVAAVIASTSLTSSAVTNMHDPNCDGEINLADSIYIIQALDGFFAPRDMNQADFDGNGIISEADITKIQEYRLGLLRSDSISSNNSYNDVNLTADVTDTYYRHDYDTSSSLFDTYTLTTTADTNNSNNMPMPFSINPPYTGNIDATTAVVRIENPNGTGFIIDDHTIVTSASCVYNRSNGRFRSFEIVIVDDNGSELDVITPKYAHIPANYKMSNNYTQYNYALVYVEEDLSSYGKMTMGMPLNSYITNSGNVNVIGFPRTYPSNVNADEYEVRYNTSGQISPLYDGNIITHYADTTLGDSGAPVYVEEAYTNTNSVLRQYKTVIGINVSDYLNDGYAIRITPEMIKFYYRNNELIPSNS